MDVLIPQLNENGLKGVGIIKRGMGALRKHSFTCLEIVILAASLCLVAFFWGCSWNTNTIEATSDLVPILFTYRGQCETVCLGGDFNDWSANSHCLTKNGDIWEIRLFLSPGRYRYAFILDGAYWRPDVNALLQEDDGFGMKNSVLIIEDL